MTEALGSTPHFSPTINLLMVMTVVWTAGVVFRKIDQPPVLGELLAGIIFGPSLLGLIRPDATIKVLSDLGVFFLMFYAGLETNPFDLKRTGRQSFLVGFGGFLVPFAMGYAICRYYFGVGTLEALFVGLGLSITSIAVNARVLMDLSLQRFVITPVIIGASIADDVFSLGLFSIIVGIAAGDALDWLNLSIILLKVVAFFSLSIFIGMWVYPVIKKYFATREAKGFTFALIMALVFGLMAEVAGLHLILGAYMAGLFVREGIVHKGLFQKINDRFVAITYGFLGPVFFVSLSFHMTFAIFRTHLWLIVLLLAVAVIGKIAGAGVAAYLGRMNRTESWAISFAMNGRGAVELVIASVGLDMGIINDELFSILVVVAFVTTFIPPVAMSSYLGRVGTDNLTLIDEGQRG
jgi:Kef-type K+ transport system membrane component KefB